jgi:hypothetical protein
MFTASVNDDSLDVIITKEGEAIELENFKFDDFDEAIKYAKYKMQLLESKEVSSDIDNKVISGLIEEYLSNDNETSKDQLQLFLFLFEKLTADKKRRFELYDLIDKLNSIGVTTKGYRPF